MSVLVTIHFPVSDVAEAIEGLQRNAAGLEEISESTRGLGLVSHRFVAGDGELMVVDEWGTAEQFQGFFDGNAKVAEVIGSIGVTGPPVVSIFRRSTPPAPSDRADRSLRSPAERRRPA